MARKKKPEEHENHERWLVSYADFITLLFAFFVVMYAISSVNEGKYRTLSHSLVAAFQSPVRSLDPVQTGELARTREQVALAVDIVPRNMPLPEQMMHRSEYPNPEDMPMSPALNEIADQIVTQMRDLIEQNVITVRRTSLWLEVEINTSILFASGSAQLAGQANSVLLELAEILKPFPNPVRVEGFTDNVPISSAPFPSNWELSAARAARVVRLFADAGVEPSRLAAMGFGEHRPVADNATAEGRNQNRRVALVIVAGKDDRYTMDVQREQSTVRLSGELPPPPTGAAPGVGQ